MSRHTAEVSWRLQAGEAFTARRYSREHRITLDGGLSFAGSASPGIVPAPWSSAAAADPEELFVAALSACHMLWFLDLAARAGVEVRAYCDQAEGELGPDPDGGLVMRLVTLRPQVEAAAEPAALDDLHHQAHAACFLARAVRCELVVAPVAVS